MIFLFLASVYAADEVHAVAEGAEATVQGPAVWMNEDRFTRFLIAEQQLPACRLGLQAAAVESVEANTRAAKAFALAREQLDADDLLTQKLTQDVAALALRADAAEGKLVQLRSQRNVAWGIAAGFLAASATATVLVLSR